jgi:hypothetical protein
MREVLLTGKESQVGPPLLRRMIADRSAQHWITIFNGIQNRLQRHGSFNVNIYLTAYTRKDP